MMWKMSLLCCRMKRLLSLNYYSLVGNEIVVNKLMNMKMKRIFQTSSTCHVVNRVLISILMFSISKSLFRD